MQKEGYRGCEKGSHVHSSIGLRRRSRSIERGASSERIHRNGKVALWPRLNWVGDRRIASSAIGVGGVADCDINRRDGEVFLQETKSRRAVEI